MPLTAQSDKLLLIRGTFQQIQMSRIFIQEIVRELISRGTVFNYGKPDSLRILNDRGTSAVSHEPFSMLTNEERADCWVGGSWQQSKAYSL